MNFKNFQIVKFIIGKKASFYSIKLEGEKKSETEKFFEKFEKSNPGKVNNIYQKIESMAIRTGCLDYLFTLESGNIVKLKEGKLRLYCMRFGNCAVILGGGGFKGKKIRATQDSEELMKHVNLLKEIDILINKRIIEDKEIKVTDNGLKGNLIFKKEE